jgi:hypothetical protein
MAQASSTNKRMHLSEWFVNFSEVFTKNRPQHISVSLREYRTFMQLYRVRSLVARVGVSCFQLKSNHRHRIDPHLLLQAFTICFRTSKLWFYMTVGNCKGRPTLFHPRVPRKCWTLSEVSCCERQDVFWNTELSRDAFFIQKNEEIVRHSIVFVKISSLA